MLHPNTLERCTHAYRRGYNAGYFREERKDPCGPTEFCDRPFAAHDFEEGYEAGANDRHWDDIQIALRRTIKMKPPST